MRVIRNAAAAGERVIALGTFDGVHKGHRKLIHEAKKLASELGIPLRVCTFDRHPLEILRPENPPELLSTIPEKAAEMLRLGVDEMELISFDHRTAETEPEMFLNRLRSLMTVRAVVAGWNYTFGRMGRGNADLLRKDGGLFGYQTMIVSPETLDDGTVISSSLVRQQLRAGLIREAKEMLGYSYTITGTVRQGKQQGRGLGFPTANIEPWKRKALPKFGVYTCLLEINGTTLPAVANIGIQPTMPSGKVTVEAHVLEPCQNLYGMKIRMTPLIMMREERKFDSPAALKEQIATDREMALKMFNMA